MDVFQQPPGSINSGVVESSSEGKSKVKGKTGNYRKNFGFSKCVKDVKRGDLKITKAVVKGGKLRKESHYA